MKKITGKALSLVLSLALVVSSFSAAFAFAATKSVTGVLDNEPDTDHPIYLVNAKDTGSYSSGNDVFGINGGWSAVTLETKDHQHSVTPEVAAISHASGDKLVKWDDLDADNSIANLTLRNTTVEGKETLSLLYEGTYYDDDAEKDVTVKAKATLVVYVVDEGADYLGAASPVTGGPVVGSTIDDDALDDFSVTRNSLASLGVYKAQAGSGDAQVQWDPLYVQTANPGPTGGYVPSATGADDYYLEVTSGADDIHLNPTGDNVTTGIPAIVSGGSGSTTVFDAVVGRTYSTSATTDSLANSYSVNGKVGNVVVTAKKIVATTDTTNYPSGYKASSDSDEKLTLKSKIAKQIDVQKEEANRSAITYTTVQKDKKTYLRTGAGTAANQTEVPSGYTLKFDSSSAAIDVIDKASVSSIIGTVDTLDISDGSNVSTVDLDAGDVTVEDAKTGSIDADAVTVDGEDAKTGDIDAAGAVIVHGGTTGAIDSDATIDLTPTDEEVPIVVGAISAGGSSAITVDSADSKVTIASIKATDASTDFSLTGDSVSVGTIDFDNYDVSLTLDNYKGSISLANASYGSLTTSGDEDEDSTVTVTKDTDLDTISIGSDTTLVFAGKLNVNSIDGDGTLLIGSGNLYVVDSASGIYLKLSDATLTSGLTAFKADADAVEEDDINPVGFTLVKSSTSSVDTFKIDTLKFAGLQIASTVTKIVAGESATFTASAYPGGTTIPEDATIVWDFDGSDDVFEATYEGSVATLKVLALDPDFASENQGTLTAKLQDEDGYDLDDYGTASVDVSAVKVAEWKSDTTVGFSLAPNASYRFKITSASQPVLTAGTANVFSVTDVGRSGNDWFIDIKAIGKVGAESGIYVNGTKLLVASIKSGITSDTTSDITVKKGASYTYKITAPSAPTFSVGTANVLTYKLTSQSGNNYFYQITAVGAVGAKAGIYVNGEKINAVTIG